MHSLRCFKSHFKNVSFFQFLSVFLCFDPEARRALSMTFWIPSLSQRRYFQTSKAIYSAIYLTHLKKSQTTGTKLFSCNSLTQNYCQITTFMKHLLLKIALASITTLIHHQKTAFYKLPVRRDQPYLLRPPDHLPAPSDRQLHPWRRPTLYLSETLKHHTV